MNQKLLLRRLLDRQPPIWLHVALRSVVCLVPITCLSLMWIGDVTHYFDFLDRSNQGLWPYNDYTWEFPPFTLVFVALALIAHGSQALFCSVFVILAIACEVWTMLQARKLVDDAQRSRFTWYWLCVCVPLSAIAYFRFDWFATAFGAMALVGFLQNRSAKTVLAIVANFGLKMWAWVFFVPLIARRRFATVALSAVLSLALLGGWYLYSPVGFNAFWAYRKGSEFQVESIPGSLVLLFSHKPSHLQYGAWMISDAGWKWLQPALPAIFVVAAFAALVVAWFRKVNQIALLGALILLMLLTSRLISPQYLVWLTPFIAILAMRDRVIGWLFAVSGALTLAVVGLYTQMLNAELIPTLLIVARNFVLCVLLVRLFVVAFRDHKYDVESKPLPLGLDQYLSRVFVRNK